LETDSLIAGQANSEGEGGAGSADDGGPDAGDGSKRVGVRRGGERANRRRVRRSAKVVAARHREAAVGAVQRLGRARPHVVLHQQLGSVARVDPVVVVVEDYVGVSSERKAASEGHRKYEPLL
jgi:hypothetical protein